MLPGGAGAVLDGGRLVAAWRDGELALDASCSLAPPADDPDRAAPASAAVAAEVLAVASWLDTNARRVRIMHADRPLSSPLTRLPTFAARA
jgi:hypothetical protein